MPTDQHAPQREPGEGAAEAFGVVCSVSGGVTGARTAWLKAGGEVARFPARDAARDEAARLNAAMNGPNATASFRYSAAPLPPDLARAT